MDNITLNEAMYNYGREKALELREEAPTLSDSDLINQELFIPTWRQGPQILDAPVRYEGQVYRVLQAHDSTNNSDWTPLNTPALFGICHTKYPDKAKPWVQPYGTSGMYYQNDCYIDDEGIIWQQIYDGGNVYDAMTLPERWKQVDLTEEKTENRPDSINNENNDSEQSDEDENINNNQQINEYPEWIQPVGAQDAYAQGAQVSHNNSHWISMVDNNVWEPGVYGWEQTD